MQALLNTSAQLFDRFFSSFFSLYDGEQDISSPTMVDEEPDENHPLAHSYFGA